jgi:hypothetical protein
MITEKDNPEPNATRSTSQLWSRRQTLKDRRADIDAEIAEIETKLKAELEAQ